MQLAFQIIAPFAGQRVRRHTHHEFKITRQNGEQVLNGSFPTRILADSFKSSLKVGVASIVLIDAGHKCCD